MGMCQGRMCGDNAARVLAAVRGTVAGGRRSVPGPGAGQTGAARHPRARTLQLKQRTLAVPVIEFTQVLQHCDCRNERASARVNSRGSAREKSTPAHSLLGRHALRSPRGRNRCHCSRPEGRCRQSGRRPVGVHGAACRRQGQVHAAHRRDPVQGRHVRAAVDLRRRRRSRRRARWRMPGRSARARWACT